MSSGIPQGEAVERPIGNFSGNDNLHLLFPVLPNVHNNPNIHYIQPSDKSSPTYIYTQQSSVNTSGFLCFLFISIISFHYGQRHRRHGRRMTKQCVQEVNVQ